MVSLQALRPQVQDRTAIFGDRYRPEESIHENTEGPEEREAPINDLERQKRLAMHKKKGEGFLPKINYICIAMYKHLISEQRCAICLMLQKDMSPKDIVVAIGVSPSTITRELKLNSGSRRKYNWNAA